MKDLIHETNIPDNILQELMDRLCEKELLKQVVSSDPQGAWVLGRDADKLSLDTIHQALSPDIMDVPEEWQQTPIGRTLSGIYFRLNREQHDILKSITIRELLERERKEIEDGEEVITQ